MPGSVEVSKAKLICFSCQVKSQCLAFALAIDASGIYAGLTDAERSALFQRSALANGKVRVSWTQEETHPSWGPGQEASLADGRVRVSWKLEPVPRSSGPGQR